MSCLIGHCCASPHPSFECADCAPSTPLPIVGILLCSMRGSISATLTVLLCPAVCTAPSRLFVHEAIYDQFLDKVLQLTKKR